MFVNDKLARLLDEEANPRGVDILYGTSMLLKLFCMIYLLDDDVKVEKLLGSISEFLLLYNSCEYSMNYSKFNLVFILFISIGFIFHFNCSNGVEVVSKGEKTSNKK